MARIWANRLEAGTFLWADCPDYRKAAVKEVLQEDVRQGRISKERYQEITGEAFQEV